MAKPRFQDDRRAYKFTCPSCASKPGEDCTAPTELGQRKVNWIHLARTDLLAKEEDETLRGQGSRQGD